MEGPERRDLNIGPEHGPEVEPIQGVAVVGAEECRLVANRVSRDDELHLGQVGDDDLQLGQGRAMALGVRVLVRVAKCG